MFQMIYHIISLIKVDQSLLTDSLQNKANINDAEFSRTQSSNTPNESKLHPSSEYMSQLLNIRKKLIGNDYVNIVWLENPFQDFDSSLIISGAILIYIVVYPISDFHNLIKIKFNKRSKFNIIEKVLNCITEELCIEAEGDNLSNYLVKLVIHLNLIINYTLQKTAYKNVEFERSNTALANSSNTSGNRYTNLYSQIHFDTNLTQRYKDIERIIYKFKNSI